MIRAAVALVIVLSSAPAADARMARDQIFFAGRAPEPVLMAVVLQRSTNADGSAPTVIEAKAFLAWRGTWRTPFWDRVEVPSWPGDDLGDALEAWRAARPRRLRVAANRTDAGLSLTLRRPNGGLRIEAPALIEAGEGVDPHGRVRWRSGAGTARVNGREVKGVVLVERLTTVANEWPRFGGFEMWLRTPPGGGLELARVAGGAGHGPSVRVDAQGAPRAGRLQVRPLATRPDVESGFALPTRWQVGDTTLVRRGGELGRGRAPGGGPAVYDIGLATSTAGDDAALVFHLRD